jgi:hypothetical protein
LRYRNITEGRQQGRRIRRKQNRRKRDAICTGREAIYRFEEKDVIGEDAILELDKCGARR